MDSRMDDQEMRNSTSVDSAGARLYNGGDSGPVKIL